MAMKLSKLSVRPSSSGRRCVHQEKNQRDFHPNCRPLVTQQISCKFMRNSTFGFDGDEFLVSICIVIEPLLNGISLISEQFSLIKSYVNRSPGVANDTISVFIVFSRTSKASFVSCYVKETMTFTALLCWLRLGIEKCYSIKLLLLPPLELRFGV